MSNTHLNGDTAASSNFLIDGNIHPGTLSRVADMLLLLANLDNENLGGRPAFALHMLLSQCAEAVLYVQEHIEEPA